MIISKAARNIAKYSQSTGGANANKETFENYGCPVPNCDRTGK